MARRPSARGGSRAARGTSVQSALVDGVAAEVEVRRSARRKRTVSAYRDGERVVVLIPARFSVAEESEWVRTMITRLERSERRRRPSDEQLEERARDLSETYLGGLAQPSSVRWVANQKSRWGSCTPADRTIRVSDRVQGMPTWVLDYVLIHELAHLLEAGHNDRFWAWVDAYPQAERAKGYLEGWAAGFRAHEAGTDPDGPEVVEDLGETEL